MGASGRGKVTIKKLCWGAYGPALLSLAPQDIILAADCLYDRAVFNDFMATIAFLLGQSASAEVWMTYQVRTSRIFSSRYGEDRLSA